MGGRRSLLPATGLALPRGGGRGWQRQANGRSRGVRPLDGEAPPGAWTIQVASHPTRVPLGDVPIEVYPPFSVPTVPFAVD